MNISYDLEDTEWWGPSQNSLPSIDLSSLVNIVQFCMVSVLRKPDITQTSPCKDKHQKCSRINL